MELGLKGKVVVVTGASAGIGLAIVKGFLEEGAFVVGGSRTTETLKQLDYGKQLLPISVDLAEEKSPQSLIEQAVSHYGRIDVLINNVGIAPGRGGFLDVSDHDWMLMFRTNLMSMVRATRAAIPYMIEQQGGSIINIASESGRQPDTILVDYSAMKSAMLSISKALSNEFGPKRIRVNSVSPGPTRTPLWDNPGGFAEGLAHDFGMEKEQAIEHFAKNVRQLPLGRLGRPDEVASAVLFLASDRASFITGADYTVNGGSIRAF
jgi:NAD(P)-dependent dehydrogenase (short-subunit alcohol dehydrogenase family)